MKKEIYKIWIYMLPIILFVAIFSHYSWASVLKPVNLFQGILHQYENPIKTQFQLHKVSTQEILSVEIDEDDKVQNSLHSLQVHLIPHFELIYCGMADYFLKYFINISSNLKNIFFKYLQFSQSLTEKYIFIQSFRI